MNGVERPSWEGVLLFAFAEEFIMVDLERDGEVLKDYAECSFP